MRITKPPIWSVRLSALNPRGHGVFKNSRSDFFNLERKTAEDCARILQETQCLVENLRDPTLIPFRIEKQPFGQVVTAQIKLSAITGSQYARFTVGRATHSLRRELEDILIPEFTKKISREAFARVKRGTEGNLRQKLYLFCNHLLILRRRVDQHSVFSSIYLSLVFSTRKVTQSEIDRQHTALLFAREQEVPLSLFSQIDVAIEQAFSPLAESPSAHAIAIAKPKLSDTQMHIIYIPLQNLSNALLQKWHQTFDPTYPSCDDEMRSPRELGKNREFLKEVDLEIRKKVTQVLAGVAENLFLSGIAPYYPHYTLTLSPVSADHELAGFVVGIAYSRDAVHRSQKQILFESVCREVEARERTVHLD